MTRRIACCLAPALLAAAAFPEIRHDEARQTWTLTSGTAEYRLRLQNQSVYLEYFGPFGKPAWKTPQADVAGLVEGRPVLPAELELKTLAAHGDDLRLGFRHRALPLQIEMHYRAWGDTGTFTRRIRLTNTGGSALRVESLPELAWRLPPADYDLTCLWGGWGQERQVLTEPLRAGRRSLVSTRGRSTSLYSPWFALLDKSRGVRYAAQFAYSGNWRMDFERLPATGATPLSGAELTVSLGTVFDFEGALTLPPGASRELPQVAFTTSEGDLDDLANQLHRYQRRYVFPDTPTNNPRLVQFNSWYPFPGRMTVQEMMRCADLAAEIGAEVFVLDAGWYNKKDWSRELGDYEADPVAFPNGIQELSRHVHSRGMKFGIWVEIENVGAGSRLFQQHPEWLLTLNGKPIRRGERSMLDFSKPEVRRWARGVVDRLVRDYQLEWIKIDYNIDIGDQFDPPSPAERSGAVLLDHILNYYAWLDEVRAAHPRLVIENCSSGGLRFDLGILSHTHTTWLSDMVSPLPSLQLAYGCTLEFAPEVCNHWMVGDTDRGHVDLAKPPEWWDFMFRVPMNGQYGISSRVFDWNDALRKRAAENVALYKRLRPVIMGADVYHLTPPPPNQNPTGWMAIQYVSPDRKRSVVMAYRLGQSPGERTFQLRGLDPALTYRVSGGQTLPIDSLTIKLPAEWRTAVIEIEGARPNP